MLKYYDEALNTFIMHLTLACPKSDRVRVSYINAALRAAYNEPESSGLKFDSESQLVNYKWALVCIALEIKLTKAHDNTLKEMSIFFKEHDGSGKSSEELNQETRSYFIFNDIARLFLTDTLGILQSTVLSKSSKESALSDIFNSQIYADFFAYFAVETKVLAGDGAKNVFQDITDQFAINLLHANTNTFRQIRIYKERNYKDINDIHDIRQQETAEFMAGKGGSNKFINNTIQYELKEQFRDGLTDLSRKLLMSHRWPEKALLLEIENDKGQRTTFAQELALMLGRYLASDAPQQKVGALHNGLSMAFISKFPSDSRMGYLGSVVRVFKEIAGSENDIFNDLTLENANVAPGIAQLVADIGHKNLYTKIIRALAKSGKPYELHTLEGVHCNFQPDAKYQAFAELIQVLASNQPKSAEQLNSFVEYAFSYIECYTTVMNECDPDVEIIGDSQNKEILVKNYIDSLDLLGGAITSVLDQETLLVFDADLFKKQVTSIAAGSNSNNVGQYLVDTINRHISKLTLESALDDENQTSSMYSRGPDMTY